MVEIVAGEIGAGRTGVRLSPVSPASGVKLVVADDHKGLRAAAQRVLIATWQRCRLHWRLVGALMLETNDEWAVARRYMSLETLARVTENPRVRLDALAL